jgi:DNA-binding response OmpR family regulator
MPEMDGLALSKKLREIRTDLPILLISGAHENVTTETAAAIGVDISLMKPFLTHELSSRIRQLFTQHSSIAKE